MREFAKVTEVQAGDTLEADAGLSCIPAGNKLLVYEDSEEELYVKCDKGEHYLNGQLSDDGTHYVGFYKV